MTLSKPIEHTCFPQNGATASAAARRKEYVSNQSHKKGVKRLHMYQQQETASANTLIYVEGDAGQNLATASTSQRMLRSLLGFDLMAAWSRKEAVFASKTVIGTNESGSLALAALCALHPRRTAPELEMRCDWILENWAKIDPVRRSLYRKLFSRAKTLVLSRDADTHLASQLFGHPTIEIAD